jgi:5-methylcytosine-specific restriction enzyme A
MTSHAGPGNRPWRAWYQLECWRRRRRRQLQANPLCVMHLARGQAVAATVADHVTPHHGDWRRFMTDPLQSLCADCHDKAKKHEEAHDFLCDVGVDGWPLDPRIRSMGAIDPPIDRSLAMSGNVFIPRDAAVCATLGGPFFRAHAIQVASRSTRAVRSRRSSSRATASRKKSVRLSPSPNSRLIRAKVPAENLPTISSSH